MIYGITGKIASGKNYVASIIQSKGFEVLDLDVMAKDSYSVLGDRIRQVFGSTDRRLIASVVFKNPDKLKALEEIIYPYITNAILQHEKESQKPFFINGALIRRAGLDKVCQAVIYVEASLKLRYTRAERRNSISKEEFLARDRSQNDVDYVTNQYACPIEEIQNEQNTHLKTDVNAVLDKLGLLNQVTENVHDLDLPELEVSEKNQTENAPKHPKKKLWPFLVAFAVLAVLASAALIFFQKNETESQDTASPVEKPQIAQVVEDLSKKEDLLPVVLPEEVSKAPESELPLPEILPQTIVEIQETVQKPHLLRPAPDSDYSSERNNRRKTVVDNLPSDLKIAVSQQL